MHILTNPVIISVVLMSVLCLCRVNIIISIVVAALVGGCLAGMPLVALTDAAGKVTPGAMDTLIDGMGGNAETALSYIMLGAFAYAISQTGLALILSAKMEKVFGKNGKLFLLILAFISCFSQNLVPIHIAFIPILIPSLLILMNDLKIDRRASACAITFGLQLPYICIPAGFGLIYHGIIAKAMTADGMAVAASQIWQPLIFPSLGLIVGLFISIFVSYRKPREYKDVPIMGLNVDAVKRDAAGNPLFERKQISAMIGCICGFGVQLLIIHFAPDNEGAMVLGALSGIIAMMLTGGLEFSKLDQSVKGGIAMMGFIAFVMLVAAGYANVINATGAIDTLVKEYTAIFGSSKFIAALIMLAIGLFVTMGIGSSFSTIPIICTIYVPLCLALNFSVAATVILIGTAGALGDAGSPASDSTLGPTSGLNADGQHDHIWDTCVPTFLHYNIPLFVFALIGSQIF